VTANELAATAAAAANEIAATAALAAIDVRQGLAEYARHVIGCGLTQETRV
jgi:hypothetical protein